MAVPLQVYNMCKEMKENYPQVSWVLTFPQYKRSRYGKYNCSTQAGMKTLILHLPVQEAVRLFQELLEMLSVKILFTCFHEMGIKTGIDLDKMITVGKKSSRDNRT